MVSDPEAEEEMIQIDEEADLIHNERFIEDGFEPLNSKMIREREVKQAEDHILAMNFKVVRKQRGQSDQEWKVKLTALFPLNSDVIHL